MNEAPSPFAHDASFDPGEVAAGVQLGRLEAQYEERCSDVVEDGISGRIVPVGDVTAFARALMDLTADSGRLAQMGAAGQRSMRSSVTAEAVATQLRQFYRHALEPAK